MTLTKANRVILGIDPGIADTGYGVICGNASGARCLDYGSLRTGAGIEMSERLYVLGLSLEKVIEQYRPDVVAVEQLFFCKNVKTALVVGQARGVIMYTAKKSGLPVVEYTPLQIKQAVSAYGKASKLQVQKMVKMILALEELPKPDDAADALAAAICAHNHGKLI